MDINKDLTEKLNELPEDISYLAKEVMIAIEKGRTITQIEEIVLGEINEILSEEGLV